MTGVQTCALPILLCGILGLAYVLLRVSFVFPAAAVGEIYGFKHAWRHSAGQGWRLLLGLMFVLLPVIMLIGLILPVVSGVFMDPLPQSGEPTSDIAEAEALRDTLRRVQLLQVILEYPLLALTITYVSIAFQTCTGWIADHGNLPAAPQDRGDRDQGPDQGQDQDPDQGPSQDRENT